MTDTVTIATSPDANGHTADTKPAASHEPVVAPAADAPQPPAAFSLRRNIKDLPPISAALCVALGGALGALLRYGFIQACASYQQTSTTSTAADGATGHRPA